MKVHLVVANGIPNKENIAQWRNEVTENYFINGAKKVIIICAAKIQREKLREQLRPYKKRKLCQITRVQSNLHIDPFEEDDKTLYQIVRDLKRHVSRFRPKRSLSVVIN